MTRIDRLIDELGYMPGVGSQDDPRPERFEIQTGQSAPTENTHGLDNLTYASRMAAIAMEDTIDETELDQRRYEMEKAITAAEKDRLLSEMSQIITRMMTALGIGTVDYEANTVAAAKLIAEKPAIGVDHVCLMTARFRRTGSYSTTPSKAEVLAFKS